MEYYMMISGEWSETYHVSDNARHYYLPHVRHSVCGHEIWWDSDAIPLNLQGDAEIAPYLPEANKPPIYITEQEWEKVELRLRTLIQSANRPVPWIYPGLRVGQLHIKVSFRNNLPDLLSLMPSYIYSERLTSLFKSFTGFDTYEVDIKTTRSTDAKQYYYELVSLEEAPLAPEANLTRVQCPICGKVQEVRYDALILDSQTDFVRPEGFFGMFVSERVKEVVEHIPGIEFVPGRRLAVGPGAPSFSEVLADLKFERQMRR
jgi:hypothetical protein